MGQVGLLGHILNVHRAVGGAGHFELAVLELDVVLARFELVGGNLFGLVDALAGGLDEGTAADRRRARAVRTHALRDFVRVALDDIHVVVVDAQLVRDNLSVGRIVALAVARGADVGGDGPRGLEAYQ